MQEAIDHLQQAIKINPEFANAHYQLALLLDKKNDYKKAKSHYLKSIDLKKNFTESYFHLATMLKRKKAFKESKKYYFNWRSTAAWTTNAWKSSK